MNNNLNNLKGVSIEYHILQSFPVTCLNRDENGIPKTAMIGGATRGRLSTASCRRPIRSYIYDTYGCAAIRTKNVTGLLRDLMLENGASPEKAEDCAKRAQKAMSINTLVLLRRSEFKVIADFAMECGYDAEKMTVIKKKDKNEQKQESENETADAGEDNKKSKKYQFVKELQERINKLDAGLDGLDIALFGRMLAQEQSMNISAAAAFAHAITTHRISNEIDFFTALDEFDRENPKSEHIGTAEFNSGTYYRYVNLNLWQLAENLRKNANGIDGDELLENVIKAIRIFTESLYIAVPSARQKTMSGYHPWDYARVLVRKGQGLQASFETPVKPDRVDGGYLKPSIERLNEELDKMKKRSGSLYGEINDYSIGEGWDDKINIDGLINALCDDIVKLVRK